MTADDLIGFLRARLDEDEESAKACGGAPWSAEVQGMVHVSSKAIRDEKWKFGRLGYVATVEHDWDGEHIVRHDPARVLNEIAAKREIIEQHMPVGDGTVCLSYCHTRAPGEAQTWPCLTLRLLAMPYSGHEEFHEEWRPR